MKKRIISVVISAIAFIALMNSAKPMDTHADNVLAEETTIIEEAANYQLGDVNFDERVNAIDASIVLHAYARYQTGEEPLTPLQKYVADVNKDGFINAVDASEIMTYYSHLATTTEDTQTLKLKDFLANKSPSISTIEIQKIYYKPNTHYVHTADCHWCNEDLGKNEELIEIENTNDIECRKCSECNPEIEIVNEYVEPTPVVANNTGITDYEKQLLAEITCHEYGSNWVSTAEKAKIVAGVMNRVYSSAYPNDIYSVLMQDGQFHGSWDGGYGYWPGCITPNEDSWAAVDYYFAHQSEFGSWTSWWGDGTYNHFY